MITQLHQQQLLEKFMILQKKMDLVLLDAPISGGQAGAENGALTVMIGGDQADFDKAKDKIDCYSKK